VPAGAGPRPALTGGAAVEGTPRQLNGPRPEG